VKQKVFLDCKEGMGWVVGGGGGSGHNGPAVFILPSHVLLSEGV